MSPDSFSLLLKDFSVTVLTNKQQKKRSPAQFDSTVSNE